MAFKQLIVQKHTLQLWANISNKILALQNVSYTITLFLFFGLQHSALEFYTQNTEKYFLPEIQSPYQANK